MFRRTLSVLVVVFGVLLALLAINTLRRHSLQFDWPAVENIFVDERAAAERLAGAVRLRTVSYARPSVESRAELLKLHAYFEEAFPSAHRALTREVIGGYSLLYTWPGRDTQEKPILLMAHQDVVPIAPGTESQWHADPFGGDIRDGFVWGRGSWDDKGNLMAILEAVDKLAAEGFRPRRTIYIAAGHDEENGGQEGAAAIARVLAKRGVQCEFALDEGLLITEGIMPGLTPPLALIGVAEKGSVTVRLTSSATPGHSSIPSSTSAIGMLAKALVRIETSPMPASIVGVAGNMFDTLAPEMHGFNRMVFSNRWLFGPLIRRQMEKIPSANAMLRTTTAITVINGGNKENVLPGHAEALINFRLIPGDTIVGIVDHVRRSVGDDRIRVEIVAHPSEASPVASTQSAAYQLLNRTIREVFPTVLVAPGLVIGATDSRHMIPVADNVYRFSPVRARAEDIARFHGTDERIATDNYVEMIRFYWRLLHATAGVP